MPEYQPHSRKFKEEQKATSETKRVEKVVSGTTTVKKKSEVSKIAKTFISDDAKNVKEYVVMDVIVPMIKKGLMGALDMILNGGYSGYDGYGRRSSIGSKVSYHKRYDEQRSYGESGGRSRFDYDDIVFEYRGDAEIVRDHMEDVIAKYGFVTVADMYDLADRSAPYTSNKYGWMNIRNAEIVRAREGGYIIKLPKASAID